MIVTNCTSKIGGSFVVASKTEYQKLYITFKHDDNWLYLKNWMEFCCLSLRLDIWNFQFSSVQSLDRFGRRGDMRDDSAEILFQSFLQEALVSRSGMGRDIHSLTLPTQHFLCRPQHRSPTKVPWRMVLERLLCRGNFTTHERWKGPKHWVVLN